MRHLIALMAFLFVLPKSYSQVRYLTADETESWPKQPISIPDDYNRISSYVYLINKDELPKIFSGVAYTKEERQELGIKANDKPDFLQVSIKIKHPEINKETPIAIPLFIYDMRDKNKAKSFSGLNGMFLNDIKSESLSSNIVGQIDINALISNSSARFWQGVAKISADLGKSAVSLAMGNPQILVDLKAKLSGYLDSGISALNNLNGGQREENHTFFISLVDRQKGQEFDEIVTAARLYQIHWSTNEVQKSNFLARIKADNALPTSFGTSVSNKTVPYILVVESRTRQKLEVGTPVFDKEYNNKIATEYESFHINDHDMLLAYRKNYSTAYNAYTYINAYKSRLAAGQPDINAITTAIDFSYQFKTSVQAENEKYESDEVSEDIQKRYYAIKDRYSAIDVLVNNLYGSADQNNELQRASRILTAITNPIETEGLSKDKLYAEITKLNEYDLLLKKTGIQPATPSYQECKRLRQEYENRLNDMLTAEMPKDESKKNAFFERTKVNYPSCVGCVNFATSQLNGSKGLRKAQLTKQYKELSDKEYDQFSSCRKNIEKMFPVISQRIDSLEDFDKRVVIESYKSLKENIGKWKEFVSQKPDNAQPEEIDQWISGITESRNRIRDAIKDLVRKNILVQADNCIAE